MDSNTRSVDVIDELCTIEKIKEGRSLARFGDGEFGMCFHGASLSFQFYDEKLASLLREVLTAQEILVGVPRIYGSVDHLNPDWANVSFWKKVATAYSLPDREYVSAFVTRPDLVKGLLSQEYFDQISGIWKGRDVAVVGNYRIVSQPGWKLRTASPEDVLSHPLFKTARSVARIATPTENSFKAYDKIKAECLSAPKGTIIMLSLGPVATVLAYDLYKEGYQALDFGQILMVYGFFAENLQPKYVTSEEWSSAVRSPCF